MTSTPAMATELNFSGATPFSHFVPLWLAIERAAVCYSVYVMFCKLHVEYIFNLSSASVGIFVDSDNASLSFGYRHRVAFSLVLNASISVSLLFECFEIWNVFFISAPCFRLRPLYLMLSSILDELPLRCGFREAKTWPLGVYNRY